MRGCLWRRPLLFSEANLLIVFHANMRALADLGQGPTLATTNARVDVRRHEPDPAVILPLDPVAARQSIRAAGETEGLDQP